MSPLLCNCGPSENEAILIGIELQQSNRPIYVYYWPRLNTCRKTHIALTSPSRSCDETFISFLVAVRAIISFSRLRLYKANLCEDCTVIAAIHIRYITGRDRKLADEKEVSLNML